MRVIVTLMACAALAACSPAVPESGASGVGFDSYEEYQREKEARDAALTGSALPPPQAISSEPLSATGGTIPPGTTVTTHSNDAADVAADTRAVLAGTSTNTAGTVQPQPVATNANTQTVTTSTGISSENDFEAVGAERSIQDDAALIAQNRAQYQVIQPTALPQRSGNTGPNIVDYALASSHPVGTQVYRRGGFNKEAKFRRNCADYASPDLAQQDFLARGGPTRDRRGLDPDGDGYACAWDPTPFRNAIVGTAGGA